jgi:hypothetical protein
MDEGSSFLEPEIPLIVFKWPLSCTVYITGDHRWNRSLRKWPDTLSFASLFYAVLYCKYTSGHYLENILFRELGLLKTILFEKDSKSKVF